MGLHTPVALQNAVFYTIGRSSRRPGLRLSQFTRYHDPDHYVYHENVSKNSNGSFKKLKVKPKVVPLYAVPDVGERCPVKIIDKYIDKLPTDAFKKNLFYVRPLPNVPIGETEERWFTSVPVGKNTLNNKIKTMCEKAKINGNKTNHCLRATGATMLFDQGVPEKVIKDRTGHHSLDALRIYERTSEDQHKEVSAILSSASKTLQEDIPVQKASTTGIPYLNFGELQGCTINIYQNDM